MKDSIDTLVTRTRQTIFYDGLWELVAGSISLCGGLLLHISPHGNGGALLFVACLVLIFLLSSLTKSNLVHPPAGCSFYKGQGIRACINLIIVAAFPASGGITFWRHLRTNPPEGGETA